MAEARAVNEREFNEVRLVARATQRARRVVDSRLKRSWETDWKCYLAILEEELQYSKAPVVW